MNNDSFMTSTTLSTTTTTTMSAFAFMQYQISYASSFSDCWFASIFSFLGILFNVIVITVMPLSSGISRKVKMYNIVISVSEIMFLLFQNIISTFLDGGVQTCSGGKINFKIYFKTVAPWFCQLHRAMSEGSEGYAGWTLAVFTFERCVIVNWPLKASWFTYRRSVCMVIGATLFCAFLGGLDFYFFSPSGLSCGTNRTPVASVLATVQSYLLFLLPVFLLPILALLTILGLLRHRKSASAVHSSKQGNAELRMTVCLLILAVLQFLFRGGAPLTWIMFRMLRGSPISSLLTDLSDFFEGVAGFVYCLNFVTLVILMRPFRAALLTLLTCKK